MNPNKAGLWTANAYEGEHTGEGCIFLFSPLEIAAIWWMKFLLACEGEHKDSLRLIGSFFGIGWMICFSPCW